MSSSLPALPGAGFRPFMHLLRAVPDIDQIGIAMSVHLNKIPQQNRLSAIATECCAAGHGAGPSSPLLPHPSLTSYLWGYLRNDARSVHYGRWGTSGTTQGPFTTGVGVLPERREVRSLRALFDTQLIVGRGLMCLVVGALGRAVRL
jgi:hypothetical protein